MAKMAKRAPGQGPGAFAADGEGPAPVQDAGAAVKPM